MYKNTRVFNFGDDQDELYVVLRGQVGVLYPSEELKKVFKEGMEAVKKRVLLLKNEEVTKMKETEQFLTVLTGIKDVEKARQAHEMMKLKA